MHEIFHPSIFKNASMKCTKCSWRGSVAEMDTEHMFLTDAVELYCPDCKNYMGFVNEGAEDPS